MLVASSVAEVKVDGGSAIREKIVKSQPRREIFDNFYQRFLNSVLVAPVQKPIWISNGNYVDTMKISYSPIHTSHMVGHRRQKYLLYIGLILIILVVLILYYFGANRELENLTVLGGNGSENLPAEISAIEPYDNSVKFDSVSITWLMWLNFRIPRNFGPPHLHVSGGFEDRGITQ